MALPDNSNPLFQLAARFVNQTNRHIFLTGKAGTGKTTFLKYIRDNSFKKMAVVAPTGVAAINAGGVTMHSFFQLPFGAFIPTAHQGWNNSGNINTPHSLFKNLRLSSDKRELIQELELLIIDEVSMLRADILDEVDLILRHFRKQPLRPFGGVQILYIGDLFQLPPVVGNDEWATLKDYYKSPFFFDAQVMQQAPPLYLELKKIYRQHEQDFISLLNNIRNNKATAKDLEVLNSHYQPDYEATNDESYITLTTHNAKADSINQQKLTRLEGKLHEFEAEITGDFNERALPADDLLQLKTGAQVMFIKNDKGEIRRYFNGKIAIISKMEEGSIFVRFPGEEGEMELEKETWKNIRYQYNREKDIIEEEELGTFTQYPIRLAWAITIHKSQGLTFEKAVIDAGASFAPGQVYVALSRLTSIQGLILYSRILPHCVNTDERVVKFTRLEKEEGALQHELEQEQKVYIAQTLLQSFDWTKMAESIQKHYDDYDLLKIPDKYAAVQWAKVILDNTLQQQEMAAKFVRQLGQLMPAAEKDQYQHLQQRVAAASDYFLKLLDVTISSIQEHIEEMKRKLPARKYVKSLSELLLLPQRKKQQLEQSVHITSGLAKGNKVNELLQQVEEQQLSVRAQQQETTPVKEKITKGETRHISLQLFKEGKKIEEIATLRGLTPGTVETHLASFIITGEIETKAIVPETKIDAILKVIEDISWQGGSVTAIKNKLTDNFSFNEIRAVVKHRERLQQEA
jgi:DNA-binding NarL/FixJ family response regulator